MAVASSRRHVYFMDERGKNLERLLRRVNDTGTRIEPWIFPEANVQDIVKEAMYFSWKSPFDLVFLCAGIHNIIGKAEATATTIFHCHPMSSSSRI